MINFSLISTALISLGILCVLIFNTNPFTAGNFTLGAFFTILLTFLFASFSLISFTIGKFQKKERVRTVVFRRSFLVAVLVVGILVFSALKVLNVMSALTYTVALILVEFFFSSKKVEREIR